VLYRVEVNVIEMAPEVVFVADAMLPEAALPEGGLALATARGSRIGVWFAACEVAFREQSLDVVPAAGVIGVAFGQGPQACR
jgi:hypothetical protein